jgi:hypothetical protein
MHGRKRDRGKMLRNRGKRKRKCGRHFPAQARQQESLRKEIIAQEEVVVDVETRHVMAEAEAREVVPEAWELREAEAEVRKTQARQWESLQKQRSFRGRKSLQKRKPGETLHKRKHRRLFWKRGNRGKRKRRCGREFPLHTLKGVKIVWKFTLIKVVIYSPTF